MIKTSYQVPELRNANDEVVQEGAFGKNTALSNSTNDGWIDYVMNDLEALHDTIGDSAATLDGNGHVVEPANLAIGDEDGNRLKTSYLKLTGGTVAGTLNVRQNLVMQDNQENTFGGIYVPSSSASNQYLEVYGEYSSNQTAYATRLYLYPQADGRFVLRSTNGSTNYDLIGGSDGTLKWRGNTLAWLASPAFTGTPTAPTQATGSNSTSIATTEYVKNNIIANLFQVSSQNVPSFESGDDLNDYRTAGTYRSPNGTTTNSLLNAPVTGAGFKMVVTTLRSSEDIMQILFVRTASIYIRAYQGSSGTWDNWRTLAQTQNVLALTGGTMTGTVTQEMATPSTRSAYVVHFTGITNGTAPSSSRYGYPLRLEDTNGDLIGGFQTYVYSGGNFASRINATWSGKQTITLELHVSSTPSVRVLADNVINLGSSDYRWKQLFAGTTTISTSDERLKGNITDIPNEVLDAWGEVGWYQYQFNDSIAEKGETNARLHTGAIAQRIESVFTAHGLDANRYGLLCYDEWDYTPAERDENGNITEPAKPAGNRYSLRYEEALCMEAAYQRRRADRLEERIARLEALVNQS